MPQVVDDDGDIWAAYGARVHPAWVFLPEGGAPVSVYGGRFGDALDEQVEANFG